LPWAITEEALKNMFSKFGEVKGVHMPLTSCTGRIEGYASAKLSDEDSAVKSFYLNGTGVWGCPIKVAPAIVSK
jgi:hypothetical protein